jgi:hypothetical protein
MLDESLWDAYLAAVRLFHEFPSELSEVRLIKRYSAWLAEYLPKIDPTADIAHLRAQCRRARGANG